MRDTWRFLNQFFALRATVTIEDIEIGFGMMLILGGLIIWALVRWLA